VNLQWIQSQFPTISFIEQLPHSGQRWVFRCEHPQYGPIALKLLKPGRTKYLEREVEAVSRVLALSSSNVPRVYDVADLPSQLGPLISLIEQYIEGTVLSDQLKQGPLPQSDLLSVAVDLVTAAADAESVGVVHRDIKPANIKIDPNGKTWLLDFGIARILDLESKTRTDADVGPHSPGYSAPEQFRYEKRRIDGRSDLFAIGVVLFECATGSNPFVEGVTDRAEVLRRVETEPLPRLDLPWDVDQRFADFAASLTQKSNWLRPKSCAYAQAWLKEITTSR
jgi:serine/threonine-protein kinase